MDAACLADLLALPNIKLLLHLVACRALATLHSIHCVRLSRFADHWVRHQSREPAVGQQLPFLQYEVTTILQMQRVGNASAE